MIQRYDNETARRLGGMLESVRTMHRAERLERRVCVGCVFFNLILAIIGCLMFNYWGALIQTLVGWLMYRRYRSSLRQEKLFLECVHHVQRMWVETPEKCLWHSHQFDQCLDKLIAKT